jgi:hypothetical protein
VRSYLKTYFFNFLLQIKQKLLHRLAILNEALTASLNIIFKDIQVIIQAHETSPFRIEGTIRPFSTMNFVRGWYRHQASGKLAGRQAAHPWKCPKLAAQSGELFSIMVKIASCSTCTPEIKVRTRSSSIYIGA